MTNSPDRFIISLVSDRETWLTVYKALEPYSNVILQTYLPDQASAILEGTSSHLALVDRSSLDTMLASGFSPQFPIILLGYDSQTLSKKILNAVDGTIEIDQDEGTISEHLNEVLPIMVQQLLSEFISDEVKLA